MRTTHAQRLERWLGAPMVEEMSASMRNWYGPPIPIMNVPGRVYAMRGGDFVGPIRGGYFGGLADYVESRAKSIAHRFAIRQGGLAHMGFSSLGDLISEATRGGKRQDYHFEKTAITNAATNQSMWRANGWPPAGTFPASGGGSSGASISGDSTSALGGAVNQVNASTGDTLHLVSACVHNATSGQILLIYDRLWDAANILHTTTGNQAFSSVPARYQDTTACGSFITLEVVGTLGSTAHNATITYMDENGNTAEAGSAQAVTASSVADRLPLPEWFYRLNAGDLGVRKVTNIAFSAVSSGTSCLTIGHPLAIAPVNGGGTPILFDGINSAFNFVRIYDGACIAFQCMQFNSANTTYRGQLVLVSG